MAVRRQEEFGIRAPPVEAFRIVLRVAQSLKWKVERKDDVLLVARVKTGFGFLSIPQALNLQVQKMNEQTSKVIMSIESDIISFDEGAFQKNVKRFGEAISQFQPTRPSTP